MRGWAKPNPAVSSVLQEALYTHPQGTNQTPPFQPDARHQAGPSSAVNQAASFGLSHQHPWLRVALRKVQGSSEQVWDQGPWRGQRGLCGCWVLQRCCWWKDRCGPSRKGGPARPFLAPGWGRQGARAGMYLSRVVMNTYIPLLSYTKIRTLYAYIVLNLFSWYILALSPSVQRRSPCKPFFCSHLEFALCGHVLVCPDLCSLSCGRDIWVVSRLYSYKPHGSDFL